MFDFLIRLIELGVYTSIFSVSVVGLILWKTVPKNESIDEDKSFINKLVDKKSFKDYVFFKTCKIVKPTKEMLFIGLFNNWFLLGEGMHGCAKFY